MSDSDDTQPITVPHKLNRTWTYAGPEGWLVRAKRPATIGRHDMDPIRAPEVELEALAHRKDRLSPKEARELGMALVRAADIADGID